MRRVYNLTIQTYRVTSHFAIVAGLAVCVTPPSGGIGQVHGDNCRTLTADSVTAFEPLTLPLRLWKVSKVLSFVCLLWVAVMMPSEESPGIILWRTADRRF